MNSRIVLSVIPLSMIFFSPAVLADNQLDISLGYEQTSGDYGLLNNTDITNIPLTVQMKKDNWRFRLTIPYISVTGDGGIIPGTTGLLSNSGNVNTISGSGPVPASDTTNTGVVTHSGLGDIRTSISYALQSKPNSAMFYELTGEVKWGTASADKNLGTGENDYIVSLFSMYRKHNLKPYLSLGYRIIGDTDTVKYNDVLFTIAGLKYKLSPTVYIGMAYDYQQATVDTVEDGKIANLYITTTFNRLWSANFYAQKGFSDSVADTGIGFVIQRRL